MRQKNLFRSRKRRRREGISWGLKIFLIFLLCAAVLFAFAVLLGHYLGKLALPVNENGTAEALTTQDPEAAFRPTAVPVIVACGKDSTETEVSAQTSSSVTYTALSLRLRGRDETADAGSSGSCAMALAYTSAVASASPYDKLAETSLEALITEYKEDKPYISGLFEVGFHKAAEGSRSIIREYELSLLCELFNCGVDDIVLTGFTSQELDTAAAFIRDLCSRCDNAIAGLALEFDFFEAADFSDRIKVLGNDLCFLAVDLSSAEIPGLMTAEEVVYDRVGRILQPVSVYSIRVLVGCGEKDGYASEVSAALRAGALSVQLAQ